MNFGVQTFFYISLGSFISMYYNIELVHALSNTQLKGMTAVEIAHITKVSTKATPNKFLVPSCIQANLHAGRRSIFIVPLSAAFKDNIFA